MAKKIHPLLEGFRRALRMPDRRPPWKWAEDHVFVDDSSPMPGRWRSSNSPWVRAVMEAAIQKRRTVVKCSAQSAKTQTVLILVCYAVSEDPGPALWVMAAKDEVKDFMRDRVMPTLRGCRPVAQQMLGAEGLTLLFNGMSFYFTGAGSKSKLQSKPIRWLFLDEVRNYPPGRLQLALKRTRSYRDKAREFIISTPDMVDDEVDLEYRLGDQQEIHIRCPGCGMLQPLTFDNLRWDDTPETRPNGRWIMDAVANTIRLVCTSCDHVWRDTPVERRRLAAEAEFVALNPTASSDRASFHWNALLPTWVSWKSVVEEFLNGVAAARADPPELEPLKAFYNETLGLSWTSALGVVDDFSFIEDRKGEYNLGDQWDEEVVRFMAADKQAKGGEHYWWLVRAFAKNGHSRLIAYGKCHTYEELEELREAHGVKVANAIIDSGFRATEVYRFCSRTGWKPFKGDQTEFYIVSTRDPKTGLMKPVRRLWRKTTVDPVFGTKAGAKSRRLIPLFTFASETVKDFLAEFMRGIVGKWTLPRDVAKDYVVQITAEARVAVEDTKGRTHYEWRQLRPDNHLLDCELQILVAAIITKLVHSGVVRAPVGVDVGP